MARRRRLLLAVLAGIAICAIGGMLLHMRAPGARAGGPAGSESPPRVPPRFAVPRDDAMTAELPRCVHVTAPAGGVADSDGQLCDARDVDPGSGCCVVDELEGAIFQCVGDAPESDCSSSPPCCAEYALCVACCMRPANAGNRFHAADHDARYDRTLAAALESVAAASTPDAIVDGSNNGPTAGTPLRSDAEQRLLPPRPQRIGNFTLCAAMCRTRGASTRHENRYADRRHFCYG